MVTTRSSLIAGIALAVVATLAWALNFITPYVAGAYSLYDLTVLRFLIAGALGICGLILYRAQWSLLPLIQRLMAMVLGILGYLGYGSCIAAGVMFGGPVLTAAAVGLVPLLVALLGNSKDPRMPWRSLALPLTFITAGLLLTHVSSMNLAHSGAHSWLAGVLFSMLAVALWLSFSLLNQRALDQLPAAATGLWTALMMIGAGLGSVCLIPALQMLGLFKLPTLGFSVQVAGALYGWALLIAVVSSVIGAWAWNGATQRLPMVLSGQLVALESVFAAALGLLFSGRLPTLLETCGLVAVLLGAGVAVQRVLSVHSSVNRAA
ncbi:DMT family transporter [Pseudomonas sp.]|uniref:DMT family transporter n=1 Tax=Pseudomonas sp. TaxID=306 RepID=UPI0028B0E62C|nr:DMT family transporter [Pseudomonas sp.]